MRHVEGTFTGSGGLTLYYQAWRPDSAERAGLAIVHGIGEHSGRYMNVVNHLVPRGYAVWAYDQRGHGRSGGQRVHVDRWAQYLEDLHTFLGIVRKHEQTLPLFALGHSMGALIVLEYLPAHQQGLRGAIISGAPIQPVGVAKPYLVALVKILSPVIPRFTIRTKLEVEALSRTPAVVRAYREDPRVYGIATVRWGAEALEAVERVKAGVGEIRVPVLIIHGGADRLNSPEGARLAYEQIASPDKTLRIYPDTYHEPHNDLTFEEVVRDVEHWLAQHR